MSAAVTNADVRPAGTGVRLRWPADPVDRRGMQALIALAVLGVLLRFIGMAIGGGLDGRIGLDDATYFAGATSLVEGRLPYRDFNILHPPGILYLLSPFAFVARLTGETPAFMIARLGIMALGGVNIVLIGLVGRRVGWATALCAAALYAVWVVPAQWERSPYLIAPQAAVMLLALLQLTGRTVDDLSNRRVALAGVFIGVSGVLQVWAVIPAILILAWILITCRGSIRVAVRRAAVFVAAGTATALVLLSPFLVLTAPKMIQMIVFAQASRTGVYLTSVTTRLRDLAGVPQRVLGLHPPTWALAGIAVVVAVLVLYVAWRRPAIRLWVALALGEMWFVLITPTFVRHYAAWPALLNALCIGAAVAYGLERANPAPRRVLLAGYLLGLTVLATVTLRPVGSTVAINPTTPDLAAARCVTANEALLLIRSQTLVRSLENGCRLLPNPRSVSHVNNAASEGENLPRSRQAEYQRGAIDYYTSGDVALIRPLAIDAFADSTWTAIQAAMPYRSQVGQILVLRKSAAP